MGRSRVGGLVVSTLSTKVSAKPGGCAASVLNGLLVFGTRGRGFLARGVLPIGGFYSRSVKLISFAADFPSLLSNVTLNRSLIDPVVFR